MTSRVLNIKEVFTGACDWKMLMNVLCILSILSRSWPIPTFCIPSWKILKLTAARTCHYRRYLLYYRHPDRSVTGACSDRYAYSSSPVARRPESGRRGHGLRRSRTNADADPYVFYRHPDYFKADFFKTLKPMFILEVMLLTVFSIYTWFTW